MLNYVLKKFNFIASMYEYTIWVFEYRSMTNTVCIINNNIL